MGLCRNGPPPDLQYDNCSGNNVVYILPSGSQLWLTHAHILQLKEILC